MAVLIQDILLTPQNDEALKYIRDRSKFNLRFYSKLTILKEYGLYVTKEQHDKMIEHKIQPDTSLIVDKLF